jgi:hypothetical protein
MKTPSAFAQRAMIILILAIGMLAAAMVRPDTVAKAAGATLPYVELEAENAATNAATIGPDRTYLTLAAEASGRRAVTLSATGQYVEFTLPQQANSIVIRYSIPDNAAGTGITAPLSLYINGARQADLSLTSRYSWVYGEYPFDNNPGGGKAHRFFDEIRALLPQMNAGSKVRLQKDASSTAASYTIDFADFEQVAAPLARPAGSLSVVDYGADPTGVNNSTTAFQNAVNAGRTQGKVVWIPQGTYNVPAHITVDNVTVRGAGMWYSTVRGYGVGFFGNSPSQNVQLSDFAIFGEDIVRNDSLIHEAIGGALSGVSIIQNIWIEHCKVGVWLNGPTNGATFSGLRIRNTYADGVNLHAGVSNVVFEQSNIRNTGDDGMAMWSSSSSPDHDNVFRFNTVQLPNLANNIAVYGGYNNSVTDNYLTDTLWQGGAVHFGNRFGSIPMSGTNLIARNTMVRTGSFNYDADKQFGNGAIWLFAEQASMTGTINVNDNQILDSSYAAVNFMGQSISNMTFNNNSIVGAGTFALQFQTSGSATFNYLTASGLGRAGIYNCNSGFNIIRGPGNSGWDTTYCGAWPAPVYQQITPTATPTSTPCPGGTCPTATRTPTRTNTPTNTPTPSPIPGTVVAAVNAGGTASGRFAADAYFDQGNIASDTSTTIDTSGWLDTNLAPQAVYQTVRWNPQFTYTIPGLTPNASYIVILHWAELTFNGANLRKFNVAINGNAVLTEFDVFANSGYKRALGRAFNVTANGSGRVVIAFTRGSVDNPFINGIEVLSQSPVTPTNTPQATFQPPTNTPIAATATRTPTHTPTPGAGTLVRAINAGGGAAGSYIADTNFDQGNQFTDGSATIDTSGGFDSHPAPQAVYQSVRWNPQFTYTIPGLTAGAHYTVRLHWAELTFNGANLRKFNVAINGVAVLSDFDVFANSGYRRALGRSFTATANGSGQIVIAFTRGSVDNPFVSGIEVLTSSVAPTPTPSAPTLVKAINAGGGAAGSYIADTNFDQGNQFTDGSASIDTSGGFDSHPAPQAVYQSVRWNPQFTYTIPGLTAGAVYTVRLHWAELTFNGANLRKFNVAINGVAVLSDFDVFANSGYRRALGRTFTATANGSGQIVIAFTRGSVDNPFVSGIEVLR